MKVLIPVKRVIDANVKVRVKSRPERAWKLANVKMAMNPFCEIAVEEAIRLKERGVASEIIAVSIGQQSSQETIRTALAMGADRGILVLSEDPVEPLGVAKLLKAVVEKEGPEMVILGKQAIDGDNSQTGPMLAGAARLVPGHLRLQDRDRSRTARQGHPRGRRRPRDRSDLKLPGVVTTDLRLNEPRYASLPNIMKAKKKPLETLSPRTWAST